MTKIRKTFALVGGMLAAAAIGVASPASAQTRTWVSGVGDDLNPCSRTAPCKTFAGAITKTSANGEINCLDPGGFGAVTITKSISIVCQYTEGGIAAAATNGVTVNGAGIDVYLSGLDIHGFTSGLNGVRIFNTPRVHITNSLIRGFQAGGAGAQNGVLVAPSGAFELTITDSVIADNGAGSIGGGIIVKPGAAGTGKISLNNVQIIDNANAGLFVDVTGSTGTGIFVSLEKSVVTGNGDGVRALHVAGAQGILITIDSTEISNNSGTGLLGDGASATMRVGNSTIVGNATGVNRLNASNVKSYGDNRLNGNTAADGTFLLPNVGKL